MPNIKEFAPAQLGLQPTEIGVEATAAAARRGNAFFNEAAQSVQTTGERFGSAIRDAGEVAVKYAGHQEIANGAAHLSELQLAKDQEWQQTAKNAEPGDPSVAAKFREESLNPSLDDFRKSFMTEAGQAWAEHHIDQYRQHMFVKTSADMSRLAADNVHTKAVMTLNAQATRVYNDPTALNDALSTTQGMINGLADSSPTLTAIDNAKVKNDLWLKGQEQLVKSAVMGAINKGGDWERIANDPKYAGLVNQPELKQFADYDRRLRHAEAADAKQSQRDQKLQDQQEATDRAHKLLTDFIDPQTGEYKFPKNFRAMIATDPVLAKYPAAKRDLEREYSAIVNGVGDEKLKQTSRLTSIVLSRGIRSGDITNTDPIYFAYEHGDLTRQDRDDALKQLDARRTPDGQSKSYERNEFLKRYGPTVDPDMELGMHSAIGGQKIYQVEKILREREQELGQSWRNLYDPSKPEFFGKTVGNYRPTLQEKTEFAAQQKRDAERKNESVTPPNSRPRITTKDEYDKLPSNAKFIGPDGLPWTKP